VSGGQQPFGLPATGVCLHFLGVTAMKNLQGEYIGPSKWSKPMGMPIGRHSGAELDRFLEREPRKAQPAESQKPPPQH